MMHAIKLLEKVFFSTSAVGTMGQYLLSWFFNLAPDEWPWSRGPHNEARLHEVLTNKNTDIELYTCI